jgi:tetrahydromethanopterin S-methyltransferase subunit G
MVVNGKTFVNAKIKRLNKQITDTSKIASKVENKALEVKKTNKKEIKKEIRIDRSTYWGVLVAISLLLILLFLWQSLKKGILV